VRSRSVTGPLILVLIGLFFLISNVRPDLLNFSRIGDYWPFLLIGVGVIGLIEVLVRAGQGVTAPRPFRGPWIFWIVVVCIFFAVVNRNHDIIHFGGFNTDGVSFFGSDYDYDVNVSEPAQGVTRIVLDNLRGDLSLKGDDSAEVKVTGHETLRAFNHGEADRAQAHTAVHIERQGDQLFIRTDQSQGAGVSRVTADLDISIPKGVSVESRGRLGELTIDSVDGAVDVSAGRGDVRLNHIGQNVRIDSSRSGDIHATDLRGNFDLGDGHGGDLQLDNVAGLVTIRGEYSGTLDFRALAKPFQFNSARTEFHAEAVPGSITLDLGDLKMSNVTGPVRFQTGTRDIEATDITESLDLVVNRGDLAITATRSPLPRIEARTRNGDITLSVPEKAPFQLNGSTARGDVDNDYGSPFEAQSSGHSATIRGGTGNGPQITLTSDRGTISVKKS
jgi:DUF4097 and DUF4098 domain-containing protein YvlB